MKLLIAISSCEAYELEGNNEPLRATWMAEAAALGIDCKLFHGRLATPKDDVVVLDCDDSYSGLIEKFQAKISWAVKEGYDYVFCCLADCYVRPERLLPLCREPNDYVGASYTHETFGSYCQGGAGFLLSRKACLILDQDRLPLRHKDGSMPVQDSEDAWAGQALLRKGIRCAHHEGFRIFGVTDEGPRKGNSVIASHLSYANGANVGYKVANMYTKHMEFLKIEESISERNQRRNSLRLKRPVPVV